jgi:hypothetical protein
MGNRQTPWERRLCLSFPCVLDHYHVRRHSGPGGGWVVAESPTARPLMELAPAPICPRCGRELVPAVFAPARPRRTLE